MTELEYWLAISQIERIGAGSFKKLYTYFPDMKTAWQADVAEWEKAGVSDDAVADFISKRKSINIKNILEKLEKENIKVVTIKDKQYPKALKEIYHPPALLYYQGVLPKVDEFCLGVVGTRKISQYGKQATVEIVSSLAQNKITIVSGLALGVDALSHQVTLDNHGRTVAVLGSGIDKDFIYPSANRYLAEKIIQSGGCVMSEYSPETKPTKFNFPARNRIISGLSVGSLIIEADEKSGSLITARFALEQNREVFAVPGSIFSDTSKGTNKLLKEGAKLITNAQDILETLNLEQIESFNNIQKISPDSPEEEVLLKFLSKEAVHMNFLVKQSCLDTAKVSSTLVMMEMKGKVKNLGGMNYVLGR